MDTIFQPKSIAVVGASERKGSAGAAIMHNLIERGFQVKFTPSIPIIKNYEKVLFDFYFSNKFGAFAGIFIIHRCLEIIDALGCA